MLQSSSAGAKMLRQHHKEKEEIKKGQYIIVSERSEQTY